MPCISLRRDLIEENKDMAMKEFSIAHFEGLTLPAEEERIYLIWFNG
jgi:hypothetical protein